MEEFLTGVGFIASVVSLVSAYQAYSESQKAKEYSNIAIQVKDDLIDRRELIELADVTKETHRILREVSQIGPATPIERLQGIDCEKIAKDVERYCSLLIEQSEHFSEFFENQAKDLAGNLQPLIKLLVESKSNKQKKEIGCNIHSLIESFLPAAKQRTDFKKEHPVLAKGLQ